MDKREQLYNNLLSTKKVTEEEIGSLEDFKSSIADETNARKFHKNLLNVFDEDEIGDEEMFTSSLVDDFKQAPNKDWALNGMNFPLNVPYAQKEVRPQIGEDIPKQKVPYNQTPERKPAVSNVYTEKELGLEPKIEFKRPQTNFTATADNIAVQQPNVAPIPQSSLDRAEKVGIIPLSKSTGAGAAEADMRDYIKKTGAEFAESDEYKNLQAQFQSRVDQGEDSTKISEEFTQASNVLFEQKFGQQVGDAQQIINAKAIQDDYLVNTTKLAEHINEKQSLPEYEKYFETSVGGVGMGKTPITNEYYKHPENEQEGLMYESAKSLTDQAQEMISASENRKSFIGNAGKGIKESLTDINTWTQNSKELMDNVMLKNAVEKYQTGDKLTDAEQTILNAAANLSLAQIYVNLPRGYKAGKMFGDQIPFMIQMVAGGALSKAALSGVEKGVLGFIAKQGNKFIAGGLKAAWRGAEIGTTTAMITALQPGNVTSDVVKRQIGTVTPGTEFSGTEDSVTLGQAVKKAVVSQGIENFTELSGALFAPGFAKLGNVLGKTGIGKTLSSTKMAEAFRQMSASDVTKVLNKGAWNGFPSEVMEEYEATALHAATGDAKWSDLIDKDQSIDIILGVGLTAGIFDGIKAIGTGISAANRYKQRKDYEASRSNVESFMGENVSLLDTKDVTQLVTVLDGMADEDVELAIDYIAKKTKFDAVTQTIQKRAQEAGQQAAADIQSNINQDTGAIERLLLDDGEEVIAIGGNIDDPGTVMTIKHEDGTTEQVSRERLKLLQREDPAQLTIQVSDAAISEVITQEAEAMTYSEENNPTVGQPVTINGMTYTIVETTPEQITLIDPSDKKAQPISMDVETVRDAIEDEIELRGQEGELPDPINGDVINVDGKQLQVIGSAEGKIVLGELDKNGNVVGQYENPISKEEYYALYDSQKPISEEKPNLTVVGEEVTDQAGENKNAPEAEAVTFPTDKDGNIDYTGIIEPNQYAEALRQEFGQEAETTADDLVLEAENALKKAEKKTNVIERKRSVKTAQAELDRMKAVKEVFNQNRPLISDNSNTIQNEQDTNKTQGQELPEEGIQAETGIQQEESAKDEEVKSLQEEAKIPAPKEKPEILGNFQEHDKISKGKKKFIVTKKSPTELIIKEIGKDGKSQKLPATTKGFTIIKAFEKKEGNKGDTPIQKRSKALGDYLSLRDYILRSIADGQKIVWKSDKGRKGLATQYTYNGVVSDAERKARIGILDNNGMTPGEWAHNIWENNNDENPGNNTIFLNGMGDDQILAEIHDVLNSHVSRSQMISAAEKDIDEQIKSKKSEIKSLEASYEAEKRKVAEAYIDENQLDIFQAAKAISELDVKKDFSDKNVQKIFDDITNEIEGARYNLEQLELLKPKLVRDAIIGARTTIDMFGGEGIVEKAKEVKEEKKVEPADEGLFADIAKAESEVNVDPTEGQKEAGNYKMGHVSIQGMDISIENPKGSIRNGVDAEGNKWSQELKSTYGYFKGTHGRDGDHIDVFIGHNPESERIFVVDQVFTKGENNGLFDESKVMLGYNSREEAEAAYMENYKDGWMGLSDLTEVPVEDFKTWLYDGASQRKPFGEYKEIKKITEQPVDNENNANFVKNNADGTEIGSLDSQREQEGNGKPGRIEEITSILGGNRQTDSGGISRPQSGKSEQEELLKKYAEDSGIWFDEKTIESEALRNLPSGKEANVYLSKDEKTVIKVMQYDVYSKTPLDFLNNRIILFNELFAGTAYNIEGFTQTDKGFAFIVSQPFIPGNTLEHSALNVDQYKAQQNRVADLMSERFGMSQYGLDAFVNSRFLIQDLHLKNIIEDVNGNLYVIDAITTEIPKVSKAETTEIRQSPDEKPEHPSLRAMRESILPEINMDSRIIGMDAFVDDVLELDPKEEAIDIENGFTHKIKLSYPHSLGEQGYSTEFYYRGYTTVEGILTDLKELYNEEIINLKGKELAYGGYSISGHDEAVIAKLEKALNAESLPKSTTSEKENPEKLSENTKEIPDNQPNDEIGNDELLTKKEITGNNKSEKLDDFVIPKAFTIQTISDFEKSLTEGNVTIEQLKQAFQVFKDSEGIIKAELLSKTKPQLLEMFGSSGLYRYKNENKDRIVNAIYSDMEMTFNLGSSIIYDFSTPIAEVLSKKVAGFTQKDMDDFIADLAKQREENQQRKEAFKKAMENPETLGELRTFIDRKGMDALTLEQKALYDSLVTDRVQTQRKGEAEKVAPRIEKSDLEGIEVTMGQFPHSKTGETMYVVSLSSRVTPEMYKEINAKAKTLGGWYSSYNKQGTIAGFIFKSQEKADEFKDTLSTTETGTIEPVQDTIEPTSKTVDKLRQAAQKIIEAADVELNRERLTNTWKRANQAGASEANARKSKELGQTMINIADAIEAGEVKLLDGIKAKTHVEMLNQFIETAKYYEKQAKYNSYQEQQKHEGEPATLETIEYLNNGYFPKFYANNLKDVVNKASLIRGMKQVAARWEKELSRLGQHDSYQPTTEREMSEIIDMYNALPESERKYNSTGDQIATFKRLKAMGIENDSMLRAALREYIQYRGKKLGEDPIKKLERALVGKKVGIDFFPTPPEVCDDLVNQADVQNGMDVLEPSAGSGNIADAIKRAGVMPDVIEISSELSELLTAKGYDIVATDFMDYNEKQYDRIIMNPPFSNGMDVDHVRHAYELLKPGGRLVSIMGEGVFFRSDKKATEFRDWLEQVNGSEEKLPEKTFSDRTLLNTTNTNARVVVIEKPEDEEGDNTILFAQNNEGGIYTRPSFNSSPEARKKYIEKAIKELDEKLGSHTTVLMNNEEALDYLSKAGMNKGGIKVAQTDLTKTKAKGFIWKGNVCLISNNLINGQEIEQIWLHEHTHRATGLIYNENDLELLTNDLGVKYVESEIAEGARGDTPAAMGNELISYSAGRLLKHHTLDEILEGKYDIKEINVTLPDKQVEAVNNSLNILINERRLNNSNQETTGGWGDNLLHRPDGIPTEGNATSDEGGNVQGGRNRESEGDIFEFARRVSEDALLFALPDEQKLQNKIERLKKNRDEKVATLKAEISDIKKQMRENIRDVKANSNAITQFANTHINKDNFDAMKLMDYHGILGEINKANKTQDLALPFARIINIITEIEVRKSKDILDNLLSLKIIDQNNKGVSIAKNVDEETRQLMSRVKSEMQGIEYIPKDEKMEELRARKKELQDAIKLDPFNGDLRDKLRDVSKDIDALTTQNKKNTSSRYNSTAGTVEKRIQDIVEKQEELTQEDEDELIVLNILKGLTDILETDADLITNELEIEKVSRIKRGVQGYDTKKKSLTVLETQRTSLLKYKRGSINRSIDILSNIVGEGKENLLTWQKNKVDHLKYVNRLMINAIKGKPARQLNEPEEKQLIDRVSAFFKVPLWSFEWAIKHIDRNHPARNGELYNYFMRSEDGVLAASDNYTSGLREYLKGINENAIRIFGKDIENMVNESTKVQDEVTHIFDDQGNSLPVDMSKGQALYTYMVWQMDDGRAHLMKQGYTEESIREIEQFIGSKYMEFAAWAQDEYLPKIRVDKYNPTHIKMFGTSMAERDHYFPIKINRSSLFEKGEIGEEYVGMPSTITGNIINRTNNILPIDTEQNAFQVMERYGMAMEKWNAYAQVTQDLNGIIGSRFIRNQMEANEKGSFQYFKDVSNIVVRQFENKLDSRTKGLKIANRALRLVGVSKISYRLGTAIKQILSLPAFLDYSMNPQFMFELVKNLTILTNDEDGRTNIFSWAMKTLPSYKERVTSGFFGNEILQYEQGHSKLGKAVDKVTSWGMLPNKMVDAYVSAVGGKAVYDYALRKYRKLPKVQARTLARFDAEMAINTTQQSSEPAYLSTMQADGHILNRALTLFMNNNMAYYRKMMEGVDEMFRNIPNEIEYLEKQYKDEGRENPHEEAKDDVYKAKVNAIKRIAIFGWGINLLWNLGSLGLLAIGSDPDDRWKVIKKGIFTAPLQGIPIVGDVAENIASTIFKSKMQATSRFNISPIMLIEEINTGANRIIKASDQYGLSPELGKAIISMMLTYEGVNAETFESIVLGGINLAKDGTLDDKTLGMLFLINLPASQRVVIAKKMFKDLPREEFVEKMMYANKAMKHGASNFMIFDKPRTQQMVNELNDLWYSEKDDKADEGKYEEANKAINNYEARTNGFVGDPLGLAGYIAKNKGITNLIKDEEYDLARKELNSFTSKYKKMEKDGIETDAAGYTAEYYRGGVSAQKLKISHLYEQYEN